MKKTLSASKTAVCLCCFLPFMLYSQYISYAYDGAGNRTSRVITLSSSKKSTRSVKEEMCKTPDDSIGKRTITFYPNPVKEALTVEITELDAHHTATLNLYDLHGNCVTNTETEQPLTTLNLSALPAGTYILYIHLDDETASWTIIKE